MTNNFLFFINGSIGDFLMALLSLDSVKDGNYEFYIMTPKNGVMFNKICKKYPTIKVIEYNPKIPLFLIKFMFNKNLVVTPPTSGIVPFHQKIYAWILSRRFNSRLIGFDDNEKINKFLYNLTISPAVPESGLFIDHILFLFKKAKIKYDFNKYQIKLDLFNSKKYIENKKYIVFHPFGSSVGRSILGSDFSAILNSLLKFFPGYYIYITGSESDFKKVPKFENGRVLNLAGKIDIIDLAHLIKESSFFVGVDTGITHLASLLKIRSLVLASQGSESYWLPYYNPKATIIFQIKDEGCDIHEGIKYLESQKRGRKRYLKNISLDIIIKYIKNISNEYK